MKYIWLKILILSRYSSRTLTVHGSGSKNTNIQTDLHITGQDSNDIISRSFGSFK